MINVLVTDPHSDPRCRLLSSHTVLVHTASLSSTGPAGAPPPAPYIVSFDVSRAFDSVNLSRLLDLVEPLLRQREYLLVKYVEVCTIVVAALPRTGSFQQMLARRLFRRDCAVHLSESR